MFFTLNFIHYGLGFKQATLQNRNQKQQERLYISTLNVEETNNFKFKNECSNARLIDQHIAITQAQVKSPLQKLSKK